MPADDAIVRLFRPTRRERTLYLAARALALLPDVVKIRASGEPPVVVDGQTLDPQLQAIRGAARGRAPGLLEPTIAAGRDRYRRQTDVFRGPATRVGSVHAIEIATPSGPLRARHYAPAGTVDRAPRPAAAITVYFHGGGFVLGDLDTHDEPCRLLCRHANVHVLSVDYRLAPEHPFPAAVDDAAAALAWTQAHAAALGADPERVAVGGDSAGANLAAVIASMADPARRPVAQLLIYPATDLESRRASHQLFGEGFSITRRDLDAFRNAYAGGGRMPLDDPRVSPLRNAVLAGLPQALVAIAGFDPLRDDVAAYAQALERASVRVQTLWFRSLSHGFVHMTGVAPAAARAMKAIATAWAAMLGRTE